MIEDKYSRAITSINAKSIYTEQAKIALSEHKYDIRMLVTSAPAQVG